MAVSENYSSDDDQPESLIPVEVAYATLERQLIVPVKVPLGTTALEAVKLSNIARPLLIDPKAARLVRAKTSQPSKKK